jgi:hypothetical protein
LRINSVKEKSGKVLSVHVMKAYKGNGGIVPFMPKLGIR